jgi:hypothetical protein
LARATTASRAWAVHLRDLRPVRRRAPDGTSSDTSSGSGTSSTDDLLATFIQQLQSSQSGAAGYGASGTSTGTNMSALLFDFQS